MACKLKDQVEELKRMNLDLVSANARLARESAEGRTYRKDVHHVCRTLDDAGWVDIDHILAIKLGGQ